MSGKLKPKTKNQKPKTKNQKPKTKNQKPNKPGCRLSVFQGNVFIRLLPGWRAAEPSSRSSKTWRNYMPQLGTRKLYALIKPLLVEQGIKLGRFPDLFET